MDERRQRVLKAASELMRQYGPRKMTINDIARAAGIGSGSVYLEFANKNAIILALSQAGHARILEAMDAAWKRKGSVVARLERTLDARFEAFLSIAAEGMHSVDLIQCGGCEAVHEAQHAYRKAEHEAFTGYLAEGVAEGVFVSKAPAKTARSLLLAYAAFTPPIMFAVEADVLRGELRGVHRLVLSGLLKR